MYRIIFKLCILCSILSPSLPVQNNYRRYNVDQESFKLYGEDFKSVLKKFRRTPDYLKILQDKLGDLKTTVQEMGLQVLHYYNGKLEERVKEMIPTTSTAAGTPPTKDQTEKPYFPDQGNRKQGDPTPEPVEDSWQKIQNLDNYKVFDSQLSVAERNDLKDLGFEFAGKIVHSIIENISPKPASGTTVKFTHIPERGESAEKFSESTPTTHPSEHAVRHGIHKEEDDETVQEEKSPTTETYRLRKSMPLARIADVMNTLRNRPDVNLDWLK